MRLSDSTLALTALFALTTLSACSEEDADTGDDDGASGNMPYCDDIPTPLAEADSALGMTGAEILARVPETDLADLSWADGELDRLSSAFSLDRSSLRFVTSTAVYPSDGGASPAIAVECNNYVAVDATLALQSEDGRLDESIAVVLQLVEGQTEAFLFFAELDLDAMGGSFDPAAFTDPSRFDSLRLFLDASVYPDAVSGAFSMQGTRTDGETASAENIEVASFGGDEAE